MISARELIEQESGEKYGLRPESEYVDDLWDAAERVIERLQKRIEELEQELKHCLSRTDGHTQREAYRARLETWVRSMLCGFESAPFQPKTDKRTYAEFLISEAEKYLAAIDAFVAKREGK